VTRRIALAMIGLVVVSILVAGVVTISLALVTARQRTLGDVTDTAATLQKQFVVPDAEPDRRGVLAAACINVSQLRVRPDHLAVPAGEADTQVEEGTLVLPGRLHYELLAEGRIESGMVDDVVFAAFACPRVTPRQRQGDNLSVYVATSRPSTGLDGVRRDLLAASAVSLGLAALVAIWLGQRLGRPVRAAQAAASRIASGDLSVRLDTDNGPNELDELAQSINQLATSLERSRGLEQQFLLSVSHDLRTPLTSIRGYAEAMADGTLTDVDRGTAVILREASRLERLVHDLLDLARLDARQFRLQIAVVDLAVVGRSVADAFAPDAARDSLVLEFHGSDRPVPVVGDRDRLGQVAANLVENALKFAISRVDVSVGVEGAIAWLAIADDGPGIPPADLPHVFERLYVSSGRPIRKEVGSGLGLAIVRELVTTMGGSVEAFRAEPRGTRFVVHLPLRATDEPGGCGPNPPSS